MKAIQLLVFSLFVCLVTVLAGCGGEDNSPSGYRGETPWIGSWEGTFSSPGNSSADYNGQAILTVSNDSTITGTFVTASANAYLVTGNVNPLGQTTLKAVNVSTGASWTISASSTGSYATEAWTADGTLQVGTSTIPFHLSESLNGGTSSSWLGSWSGTLSTPGVSSSANNGTILAVIDNSGKVTGSLVTQTASVYTLSGTIANSGAAYLSATDQATGAKLSIVGSAATSSAASWTIDGTITTTSGATLAGHVEVRDTSTLVWTGAWKGSWSNPAGSTTADSGSLTITVTSDLNLTGNLVLSSGQTFSLTGIISSNGQYTINGKDLSGTDTILMKGLSGSTSSSWASDGTLTKAGTTVPSHFVLSSS